MKITIEAHCTECGSTDFGSTEKNNNKRQYSVEKQKTSHGSGSSYGTEVLVCPSCGKETVHNRCGKSVPSSA